MKLKKAKIYIDTWENTMNDLKRAIKGEYRYIQKDNEIRFLNWFSFSRSLTPMRIEILAIIAIEKPESIYALAKILNRDFKNVHSDVKYLAELGLIDLKETGRRSALKPVAKYRGIEIEFAA